MTPQSRIRVAALAIPASALLAAASALAVPAGQVSHTAAAVCEFRAIAAQHPDRKLRNGDTLAGKFCDPLLLPREYPAARDVIDVDPEAYSAYFYVNARTRYIDAKLRQAAAHGATQIVILGAGFDSRAYRFHKAHPRLAFYEVDLPATIKAKQDLVRKVFGALPAHVRYASIDFNTQSLDDVLAGAGYDSSRRTLFVLEGVTMYVSAAGNDATFEFIRRHSPAGSLLVYDYILRDVAEGRTAGLYAATKAAEGVAYIGEPFITGWTPAEAKAFAGRHGLELLEDLDAAGMTRRYLTGSNGKADGRIPEWYRLVEARVR